MSFFQLGWIPDPQTGGGDLQISMEIENEQVSGTLEEIAMAARIQEVHTAVIEIGQGMTMTLQDAEFKAEICPC